MRLLLFVLTIVLSTAAHAVQPVAGTISRVGQNLYLNSDDPCSQYQLATRNETAMTALIKLADGDSITATGTKDPSTCSIMIESIDYVGLKRLLGVWYSKDAVLAIRDYNVMRFYPAALPDFSEGTRTVEPIDYKYSVIPSEGKEWVLFLSDTKTTTFATIQFSKGPAIMKIYDSESGAVTKTLILYRKGN